MQSQHDLVNQREATVRVSSSYAFSLVPNQRLKNIAVKEFKHEKNGKKQHDLGQSINWLYIA